MKLRIKIIINPSSGRQSGQILVNELLEHLVDAGALIRADINYTHNKGDAEEYAQNVSSEEYDLLLITGGDGTVHEAINGLLKSGSTVPIAIYPGGTVNDFATHLDLPTDPYSYAQMLMHPSKIAVDVGRVGDRYFLNVLAGGSMTDIPYKVPSESKTSLGKLAYWLEGAMDISSIMNEGFSISVTSKEDCFESDAFLFIIANSKNVGGIKKLLPYAEISDGLLDVLVVSKLGLAELFPLLGKLLIGDHLDNDNIIYFQTKQLTISATSDRQIHLDLDGEQGPDLPAVIECIPGAITLIIPSD